MGSHLGDLAGEPPIPVERDRRRSRRPAIWPFLVAVALGLMFLSAALIAVASGAERGPVKVPRACERLAREAGFPPVLSPEDQDRALEQLARASGPEIRACRAAVEEAKRSRRY